MNMKIDLSKIDPQALHLMWTLFQAGFEARIAGGAVRDLIIGFPPKDWDIATTARPEEVIEVMNRAGIQTIPTGLQHGTITAVVNSDNYEITTLRADVNTDGRHAEVEFIDDWKEDAARRDFTMNAMYLDADGVVHDYFNGLTHLGQFNIQFVGDPAERIQEDYLRILRYFRFRARLNNELERIGGLNSSTEGSIWNWGHRDKVTKEAIRELAPFLMHISGERIWSELRKIIQYKNQTFATFKAMHGLGIFPHIGLEDLLKSGTRCVNLSHSWALSPEPAVRLASAFHMRDLHNCVRVLKDHYKVPREEFAPVEFAANYAKMERTRVNVFRLLSEHPKEHVLAWIAVARTDSSSHWTRPFTLPLSVMAAVVQGVMSETVVSDIKELYDFTYHLEVPEFPVRGQDLLDRGLAPGPEVGRLLKEMRHTWADLEFRPNKEYLLTSVGFENPEWNL